MTKERKEENTEQEEIKIQQELLLDIKHELLKAINFSYRTTLK